MPVIDRRQNKTRKSSTNRQKFLKRVKHNVKDRVDKIFNDTNISDINKEKADIKVPKDKIDLPNIQKDTDTGRRWHINPGNKNFRSGDTVRKPSGGEGQGNKASKNGKGMDDFEFTLTKEEFLNELFEYLHLPDYVKESLLEDTKFVMHRAGYSRDGVASNISLSKTFLNSIARRIAAKNNLEREKKPPFIEETDIRYKNFEPYPEPVKSAVMFCIMDVSGSMTRIHKDVAKRFFLMLYLFLDKNYEHVTIRFIRHHSVAAEVTEQEFFFGRETGGTVTSTALRLTADIIRDEYHDGRTNIYISHASDGDNWMSDNVDCARIIENELLPQIQYYAYADISLGYRKDSELEQLFEELSSKHDKINWANIDNKDDVFKALEALFGRKNAETSV